MIFYTSRTIDELLQWYEEIISESFVVNFNCDEYIYYTDKEVDYTPPLQNIEHMDETESPTEDSNDEHSHTPEQIVYSEQLKKIRVKLVREGGDEVTMTLFEIKEMNHWFMKKIVSSANPSIPEMATIPSVWNIFMCEYFLLVKDTLLVSHIGDHNSRPVWIVDSSYPLSKEQVAFFGIYEFDSPAILPTTVTHRIYFSSRAHSFFMHSIQEEVHVTSNTVYLVGKLFPQWEYRFIDISSNESDSLLDMLIVDPSNIQIRQYKGTWMKCPRGFEYRSGKGKDALFMFRSRWIIRKNNTADKKDDNESAVITTSHVVDTSVANIVTSKGPVVKGKMRRIHIVSEFICLFEWLKFAIESYFIDVPLSTYKYNPRGERSKIEYRFTKEECTELSTNLAYDGGLPHEWISKILVECMSIRWNSRIVFEEYLPSSNEKCDAVSSILSNRGGRITYNTHKKARLVSNHVAKYMKRWVSSESYYVIRLLFTGFGGPELDDPLAWIKENEGVFVFVWVHKDADEIVIRCSSPSTELLSWKREFDYFLSQWFSIEESSAN